LAAIGLRTAILTRKPGPPAPTPRSFGSARAVLAAFFTGRLRQQFFADSRELGDIEDATRQVGAAYVCLAGAAGWLASIFFVAVFNPTHVWSHVISALSCLGCLYGFSKLRRKKDPRPVMGAMVFALLASAAALSFRNAGVIAPIMAFLPFAAAIIALYMNGWARRIAIALGVAVLGFTYFTSTGQIGEHTAYTPPAYTTMTFATMLLTMLALGGMAWMANLARDFAMEQVKAAHQAIVESASRSRVAMEAAKVGLWDVPDAAKRQFHVSESFESITGYTGEEFDRVFAALNEFVHPDDVTPLREAFGLGRKRMSRIRVDFRLMTKTRGYRWFSARAGYSQNPDGTVRISGSLQDINFIKAAEEALRAGRDRAREANKAKSDFIAMMSHEVRTPLNAILGSVEVLKRGDHDVETEEMIGLIDDAGHGLLAMVNDLLDVSKIEAGKIDISPQAVDLPALVRRTVDFWRPQAGAKLLTLEVDTTDAEDAPVMVDPIRVRQILGNLISNAIKFTDSGGVETRLSMTPTPGGRIEIGLSVIDTGPGVPDAVAESVFAPFEQVQASSSRGGTGLGLFICRRLARLMGGDVTLEPARRTGAHFRMSITAERAAEAEVLPEAAEADPIWKGRRVLCVDDNETNRRIAELLLSKFGVGITSCASGAEAMRLAGQQTFDAVLMDIVMPGMDGFEALKRLRADTAGPNHGTPVIALTAKLAAEDMTRYADAGFDGVAGKPINVRDLVQVIAPFMVGVAKSAVH
jgi:signal transduction histidine kinase